jgi:hypothetical protein
MDEHVMLSWVNDVLRSYIELAPKHIIPLLILDSYQCHMMPSIVMQIKELGVEVRHIPGGCTSICQPAERAMAEMKENATIICNAWKKSGYEWFMPKEIGSEIDARMGGNDGIEEEMMGGIGGNDEEAMGGVNGIDGMMMGGVDNAA